MLMSLPFLSIGSLTVPFEPKFCSIKIWIEENYRKLAFDSLGGSLKLRQLLQATTIIKGKEKG
jgi:hypothetical protein